VSRPERPEALDPGAFPALLRGIYVGRRTGLLHMLRGEERASVCFVTGHIVSGDTNIDGCHLGQALVRHGLLSQWDLDRANEIRELTGRRLGRVLLDLGVFDEDRLQDALALHVREILLTVFSWHEGACSFEDKKPEAFAGYDRPLGLSTAEVILDAVWSIPEPDVIRRALGDLERTLAPSSDPLLRFQRVTLTPTDGFMLSRVDGSLSGREILELAPVGREEAERSLFGLLCIGMVEYGARSSREPRAAAAGAARRRVLETRARVASGDPYAVLGVTRGASEAEIAAAYAGLARRFHPDAHHEPELADLRATLEDIFIRVNEAYRALAAGERPKRRAAARAKAPRPRSAAPPEPPPPPPEPPRPDDAPPPGPVLDAVGVEQALGRAEEDFHAGRYWDALTAAQGLIEHARGRLRQRTRVLISRCYLKNPNWKKDAEQELRAAIAEDPGNAEAHYLLGLSAKAAGAHKRARGLFRKVLALRPRHAGALAELGPAGGAGGRGLVDKLLKRT
jgi:curved DNA-binding protein CbpA